MGLAGPLSGLILFVLIVEGSMWLLFEKRIVGLCLPRAHDASHFRFFSLLRVRLLALLHLVFVIAVLFIFNIVLW